MTLTINTWLVTTLNYCIEYVMADCIGVKSIREPNDNVNLLDIATSEIGKLQVIKGVYLQIQGEMMTCAGHKIFQGKGLKFRV